MQTKVAIIGAGPAGLTAAYLLAKQNIPVLVFEADSQYVGGISRTVQFDGYCCDIGGHRFFSKSKEVEDFWSEILPDDLLTRPRSSRIFYKNKFYSYPLKFFEVLKNLGLFQSFLCLLSYLRVCLFPIKNKNNFTNWVSNYFGRRLFNIFFKTYTEKVWGMKCEEISADWAAQRIKGLSFFSALVNAIFSFKSKKNKPIVKTLIDSFRYPRKGPGMMWEECAKKIVKLNGQIYLGSSVIKTQFDDNNKKWIITYQNMELEKNEIEVTHLISSAPLQSVALEYLDPKLSQEAILAATQLKYRDFLIVVLILKDKNLFSDNWIYIHDPSVDVARIQNFKSWSEEMVPDPTMCCYGMEYFCFENDSIWTTNNDDLINKATRELIKIGLATSNDIINGYVIRQPKAYPVYDENYKENVNILRTEIAQKFRKLYLVGRNGMHKYNNQDHSIMTAMLTVKNILAGEDIYNVWDVNQDAEYHESGSAGESAVILERAVPQKI